MAGRVDSATGEKEMQRVVISPESYSVSLNVESTFPVRGGKGGDVSKLDDGVEWIGVVVCFEMRAITSYGTCSCSAVSNLTKRYSQLFQHGYGNVRERGERV